ncbi:MAG: acyltransferase domain-containing protein [Clostridiales bacterium]|nr:acyltransferase domain-containing protein [Clostridiales bacterium]
MIHDLMITAGFPDDAVRELDEACAKITSDPETLSLLAGAADALFLAPDDSFLEKKKALAEASGLNGYVSDMVFWLYCARQLRYIFGVNGLPEDFWRGVLTDLRCKLNECRGVYGINGTFVDWFRAFYTLKRFAVGRLEYDMTVWSGEPYKDYLKDGDFCWNCHIPSNGKLSPELVMDSLKRLREFSSDKLKDGLLAVKCSSWLLYPPVISICAEDSNMRRFFDLFDVYGVYKNSNPYNNFWRVYNMMYEGPQTLEKVPTDTSFRRSLKKYIEDGGEMHNGMGVIIFDGEKIVNK